MSGIWRDLWGRVKKADGEARELPRCVKCGGVDLAKAEARRYVVTKSEATCSCSGDGSKLIFK